MGRTRNEDARQRILDAALAGARSSGYGDLTIEAIAAEAGVGKQTVYRWWRSRAEVTLEALRERARSIPVEETGRLEGDLRAFLRATFRHATGKSNTIPVLRGLMAEAQLDAAFLPLFRDFIAERRAALGGILRRHISKESDIEIGVDMVFGAMWYRMLVGHAKIDATFADELARLAARQLAES
jgi:AcrR family transcriptional regulator